ncbi:7-deoxyloganetin glucosyltransferase-like [Typha angustifolia]|uniref:7-deoxyloganetin glucosyltransferase-like n=1 Tax=Typha angustifolia TaxID=59011 RepID=UPI003C2C06CF
MSSAIASDKPHAVCIPYPVQGHINPMLKIAKLLHSQGFHVTFVNTEYNHRRLLNSRGPAALDGLADFRFATIPDGLPPSDDDATQDIPSLCQSITATCLPNFRRLLSQLNGDNPSFSSPCVPPVSCIVSDAFMSFTLDAAKELGVPDVIFWPASACAFLCCLHYRHLAERELVPLRDVDQLTNGYLDTPIDWIPGLKNMRFKDFPAFVRTLDPNDVMFNFIKGEAERASLATAILVNTFDEFELPIIEAMTPMLPPIYTIGPLCSLANQVPESPLSSLGSNLWKEQPGCLEWLQGKRPNSIVYVNFGSIVVLTNDQLIEFAWGLANSGYEFLWVIRPDLVKGDSAILPTELLEEIKERCLFASWCPQEEILCHPAIGAFLTHCGWNSTMESICGGLPMLCWPFFADQQTNCRYACNELGVGMEIDNNVKRMEVEELIREVMDGEEGKEMKRRAMEWKKSAVRAATQPGGTSFVNFERFVLEVLKQGSSVLD